MAATSIARAEADTAGVRFYRFLNNFEFLPHYYLRIDLSTFLLHKSSLFKERYFLENNTEFEFALLGIRQKVYSVWGIEYGLGMGRTPSDVLFDPVDVSFGIIPTIEYRTRARDLIQVGVEHRCFHEIDRYEMPTVYWNKPFVAVGSRNRRLLDFRQALNDGPRDEWTFRDRFSWYVRWGFFAKRLGDIVDPWKINGNNDGIQEGWLDCRYALWRQRSWMISVREYFLLGSWSDAPGEIGAYWRETMGIEAHFRRGAKGGMLFVDYTLDDLPLYGGYARFTKDQLLRIGVAFYM